MKGAFRDPAVARFAVAQFLLEVQFWFPVWLIFLDDRGFSITTAVLADGVFRLVVVVLEIPLGALADRIGRRTTYLAVAGSSVVVFSAITAIEGATQLFVVWIAWGALWALASGTGQAYGYELLVRAGGDVGVRQGFGALRAVSSAAVLVSHLSAGLLYELFPSAPFALTAVLAAAAFVIATTLPRVQTRPRRTRGMRQLRSELSAASRSGLRQALWLAALTLVAGWTAGVLFQPLVLELDLSPVVASAMYFGYSASALVASAVAGRVTPERRDAVVVSGFAALTFALASTAAFPLAGVALFIPLLGFSYHLVTVVLELEVNERAGDAIRATAFSVVSSAGGLVMFLTRPALGSLADARSTAVAFGAWAGVCVVLSGAAAYVVARRRPGASSAQAAR